MTFRFALVIPPTGRFRRDERCQSAVESQTAVVTLPPVDLARYGAIIRQKKHIPRLFDFQVEDDKECLLRLLDFKPHFMLVSVSAPTEENDFAFIDHVRKNLSVRVLIKGGRSFWQPRKLLRNVPAIDGIFTGEVEKSLEALLECNGKPDSSISAFAYRDESGIQLNTQDSREEELSRFPYPARDLLQNKRYLNPATRRPMTVIHAHRGCPATCIFCPAPLVEGKKVRFRSVEDVVGEIKECVDKYSLREFLFDGDTFTIDKKWVLSLCQALQEAGLDIQWACNSRVDTIDKQMVREMKKAGCWIVGFGIESGNDEMLRSMGKNATTDDALRAVRLCQSEGVKVHTFYIIGLPGETEDTLKDTLSFAKILKADFFDVNLATPLPGTPFYEIVQKNQLYTAENGNRLSYSQAGIRSFALDNATLKKWRRKMLLLLTFSPGFIIRSFRFAWQQRQLSYYTAYGLKRLKNIMGS